MRLLRQPEIAELIGEIINAHEPRPCEGVYFLLHAGEITYVGTSRNVLARMSGHKNKSFDSVKMVSVKGARRIEMERQLIEMMNPRDNIANTGGGMYADQPNWDALKRC